jgi:uncharacterized surface protein with fasciclin (FAS1) repeats
VNLLAKIISRGAFRTFITMTSRAGLSQLLGSSKPYTVFVPVDAAFTRLAGDSAWWLANDRLTLRAILACHIVPGRWTAPVIAKQHFLHSLDGERLRIDAESGIWVAGARIIETNLIADNGVVHIIDRVLLPNILFLAPASLQTDRATAHQHRHPMPA